MGGGGGAARVRAVPPFTFDDEKIISFIRRNLDCSSTKKADCRCSPRILRLSPFFIADAMKMAPALGFEPRTKWLTATYSTAELCRSVRTIIYSLFAVCQSLSFKKNEKTSFRTAVRRGEGFPFRFVFSEKRMYIIELRFMRVRGRIPGDPAVGKGVVSR